MNAQAALITGGVRSGKSRYALKLASESGASRKFFIATAEPLDEEMKLRIARHQDERRESGITTIEEPVYLAKAIRSAETQGADFILVDCLTVWVNNLLYHLKSENACRQQMNELTETVKNKSSQLVFITNEVGVGMMPVNPLARRFADELGGLNQRLAEIFENVIVMTAGIPLYFKKDGQHHGKTAFTI